MSRDDARTTLPWEFPRGIPGTNEQQRNEGQARLGELGRAGMTSGLGRGFDGAGLELGCGAPSRAARSRCAAAVLGSDFRRASVGAATKPGGETAVACPSCARSGEELPSPTRRFDLVFVITGRRRYGSHADRGGGARGRGGQAYLFDMASPFWLGLGDDDRPSGRELRTATRHGRPERGSGGGARWNAEKEGGLESAGSIIGFVVEGNLIELRPARGRRPVRLRPSNGLADSGRAQGEVRRHEGQRHPAAGDKGRLRPDRGNCSRWIREDR